MTVTCNKTEGEYDPLVLPRNSRHELSESNYVASSEWHTINDRFSAWCITQGQDYTVYAIIVYGTQSRYLIVDDNHIPGFFPTGLFSICESGIFFDWEICEYTVETKSLMVIGYPTLCESFDNLVGLLDGQKQHIERFLAYIQYVLSYKL